VGKGENMPVSAEQIGQVLGGGQLAAMAEKFGVSPEVLSGQLAQHLPGMVDKLTPDGAVPADESNLLSQVFSLLK
jgi:uncharacterized protein YidB (DUF937 family)